MAYSTRAKERVYQRAFLLLLLPLHFFGVIGNVVKTGERRSAATTTTTYPWLRRCAPCVCVHGLLPEIRGTRRENWARYYMRGRRHLHHHPEERMFGNVRGSCLFAPGTMLSPLRFKQRNHPFRLLPAGLILAAPSSSSSSTKDIFWNGTTPFNTKKKSSL